MVIPNAQGVGLEHRRDRVPFSDYDRRIAARREQLYVLILTHQRPLVPYVHRHRRLLLRVGDQVTDFLVVHYNPKTSFMEYEPGVLPTSHFVAMSAPSANNARSAAACAISKRSLEPRN